MRIVLAFLLPLLATPAWALSPEEAAYIAARDRAAAALEQKWDSAAHDKAIGTLTPMLRADRRSAAEGLPRSRRDGARQPVLRRGLGQARRPSPLAMRQ